jgi:hypothetical protein
MCGVGDRSLDGNYDFWPLGNCLSIRPLGEHVDVDAWIAASEAALPRFDVAGQAHPPGSWEDLVWGDYWQARRARGQRLLDAPGTDEVRRKYVRQGVEILEGLDNDHREIPSAVRQRLDQARSWLASTAGAPTGPR